MTASAVQNQQAVRCITRLCLGARIAEQAEFALPSGEDVGSIGGAKLGDIGHMPPDPRRERYSCRRLACKHGGRKHVPNQTLLI